MLLVSWPALPCCNVCLIFRSSTRKHGWTNWSCKELPSYLAECMATPPALWKDCDIEALWHEPRFQRVAFWHRAALAIMLAQPSSAPIKKTVFFSIERVFSALLKTVHVVGDNQGRGLSDYQSESMMIYYNSRERARPWCVCASVFVKCITLIKRCY